MHYLRFNAIGFVAAVVSAALILTNSILAEDKISSLKLPELFRVFWRECD